MGPIDLSWWPELHLDFPYAGVEGLVLNFKWLDDVLKMAGLAVAPLLLLVAVFFAFRGLFVDWKGGN